MTAEPRDYPDARTPTLIVVGDTPAARARGAGVAAALGFHVAASLGVVDASARLEQGPVPGAVIVDIQSGALSEPETAAFESLLLRLYSDAAAGRHGSVVVTPPGLIDLVAARAAHPQIEQLSAASDADCAFALAIVARRNGDRVRETPGTAVQAADLRAIAEQVSRLSGTLARLLPAQADPAPEPSAPRPRPTRYALDHATLIREILRSRRLRGRFFDPELFADPAWDMLLDLMAAHFEATPVAVSSLCIAAAVPATTALRWIRLLTEAGLFERRADPTDGRRVFIELSKGAAEAMRGYLDAATRV